MTDTRERTPLSEERHTAAAPPTMSAAAAERTLREMELDRVRNLREQQPTAELVLAATAGMGRPDLARRARLILADIAARNGAPVDAANTAREVQQEAEAARDAFGLARALYVLAWIDYSTGNHPSAQVAAIRSVELLPEDCETGLWVDHTMMIGIAYAHAEEGQRYFDEALELARRGGDDMRLMIVHNNAAYAAAEYGNLDLALRHITAMRAVSWRSAIPMFAIQTDTIARVYIMAGRYDEAVAALTEVLDRSLTSTTSDDVTHLDANAIPIAMLTLAEAHRHLGELDRAAELLDRAAELALANDNRMIAARIRRERAYLLADRDDYRGAFAEFTAFYDQSRALEVEEEQARARVVQVSFDAERNRRNAERYRELAMRDVLTGLYNRRYMEDLIGAQISAARETGRPLSVAIIDADLFKRVNDQLSHDVGDTVLRTLGEIFVANRHRSDTVCRLGGEEFVLVMAAPAEEAFRRCEVIRSAVADHDWRPLIGTIPMTVSIGVTTAAAGRTSNSAILADADRNLYAAKRSGRNRVMGDIS